MRNKLAVAFLFAVSCLLAACGSSSEICDEGFCPEDYPSSADVSGKLLYVSAGHAPEEGQDGTIAAPFALISQAVAVAEAGDCILVQTGLYEETESLVIDKSLTIKAGGGFVDDWLYLDRATLVSTAENAIHVQDATEVTVAGLTIASPVGAGILVEGSDGVELVDNRVFSAKFMDGEDEPPRGFGISVGNSSGVTVDSNVVEGNAGAGINMVQSYFSIIVRNLVSSNHGGIALSACAQAHVLGGSPGEPLVDILENRVVDNVRTGVRVLSSAVRLEGNIVAGTVALPGDGNGEADGIVVAREDPDEDGNTFAESEAWIGAEEGIGEYDNQIYENDRAGLLVGDGSFVGIIVRNYVALNGVAGMWIQDGAKVGIIVRNLVQYNLLVGIGLTTGAHAVIGDELDETLGNMVEVSKSLVEDWAGEEQTLGDAVGIFNGGSARVHKNTLAGHGRVGVLMDNPNGADTVVKDNIVDAVGYGVALQNFSSEPDLLPVVEGNKAPDESDVELTTLEGMDVLSAQTQLSGDGN